MMLHLQRSLSSSALLAFLVGAPASSCVVRGPASGTAVGNPGTTSLRTGKVEGLPWTRAEMAVASIQLTGCDGETEKMDVGQTLNLLSSDPIDLPDGSWCSLQVKVDGPLILEGVAASGARVDLSLNVHMISFKGAAALDGSVIVELGGPDWVADAGYDPSTGGDVVIAAGGSEEASWRQAFLKSSGVYADSDDNGEVSDDERAEGRVEDRDEDADEDTDEDEGDDTGEGARQSGTGEGEGEGERAGHGGDGAP